MSKNFEARKRETLTMTSVIKNCATRRQSRKPSFRASQLPIINDRSNAIGTTSAETCQWRPKQIMTRKCIRQKKNSKVAAIVQESVDRERYDSDMRLPLLPTIRSFSWERADVEQVDVEVAKFRNARIIVVIVFMLNFVLEGRIIIHFENRSIVFVSA